MDSLQTKLLADTLLPQILDGINNNQYSFLSLVRIAKENDLFFPQLYETFFSLALSKSFYLSHDPVANNYTSFNLNAIEAGTLFVEIFKNHKIPFLNGQFGSAGTTAQLNSKVEYALSVGLILPDLFLSKDELPLIQSNFLQQLIDMNHNNMQAHLENLCPEKASNNRKKI